MSTITANASTGVGVSVVRNDCWKEDCGQGDGPGRRADPWTKPHCRICHQDGHRACLVCGTCLVRRHPVYNSVLERVRWDRLYCGSTCRGRARKQRALDRMAYEAWAAENPEEAARESAKWDRLGEMIRRSDEIEDKLQGRQAPQPVKDDLRARADRCAHTDSRKVGTESLLGMEVPKYQKIPCPNRFGPTDVIYLRVEEFGERILPYCRLHICEQPAGHHNRDSRPGGYYPECKCLDDENGKRHWTEPEPCVGCGRLVRYDRKADPRRFVRSWSRAEDVSEWRRMRAEIAAMDAPDAEKRDMYRDLPSFGPVIRTFCSTSCRQSVFKAERKANLLALRPDLARRCDACHREFAPRYPARYCSNACRQKAYRARKAAP